MAALLAPPAGNPGFECDPLTDRAVARVAPDGDDHAGTLVPEDQRRVDDEVADPPVFVIVHVGAAHSDGPDFYENLVGAETGDRALLQPQVSYPVQHGGRVVVVGVLR
jgi:hypothetical protein